MKKKILIFLFTFLVSILFTYSVKAEVEVCQYSWGPDTNDGSIGYVYFYIDPSNAGLPGTPYMVANFAGGNGKEYDKEVDRSDHLVNWYTEDEGGKHPGYIKIFNGRQYYRTNKKCPPYLVVADTMDMAFSDEANLETLKNALYGGKNVKQVVYAKLARSNKQDSLDSVCRYKDANLYYTVTIDRELDASGMVSGYPKKGDFITSDEEDIDNWRSIENGTSSKAIDMYNAYGCPKYAILANRFNADWATWNHFNAYLVYDEEDKDKLVSKASSGNYEYKHVLTLMNPFLLGKTYTVKFVNTRSEETIGTFPTQVQGKYGEVPVYVPEVSYKIYGLTMIGYKIKTNGKWRCHDGSYRESCTIYEYVRPGSSTDFDFELENPVIELYTEWKYNQNIDSQTVNHYRLGKNACVGRGFIWNELDETNPEIGYCNVDHLKYIMCGDTHDIPIEVPNMVSYVVNLLKIATPIILIIVCIITLLKAMAASNEDELKKAQKGLIRKMIAAAMVFFIVSIVQFVILKAADSSDEDNILDCMSCFVNGDCLETTYYKTTIQGVTYCTKILNNAIEKMESCDVFYQKNK